MCHTGGVHAQKMENVQMALDFITKKERIRLVNIGKARSPFCDLMNNRLYVRYAFMKDGRSIMKDGRSMGIIDNT